MAHCQSSLKISCKSVRTFLRKIANRQTNNDENIFGGGDNRIWNVLTCTADDCLEKSFHKSYPKSADVDSTGESAIKLSALIRFHYSIVISTRQCASLPLSCLYLVTDMFLSDVRLCLHVRDYGNHLSPTWSIQERLTEQVSCRHYSKICLRTTDRRVG